MRTVFTQTAWVLGLLLATSTGWAQQGVKPIPPAEGAPKPGVRRAADEPGGVHRMVIYNGPVRTVHYVYDNVSPSEESSMRDLERAENEVALADQLLALKLQYVRDERQLQSRRTEVQRLLYGYSSETTAGLSGATGGYPFGLGYGGYGVTGGFFYPGYGIAGAGAAGYPFGGGVGFGGYVGSGSNSLAYGVGDEGAIKTEIAKVLANEANPGYAAGAEAKLAASLSHASQYESARGAMGVKEPIALTAGPGVESRFGVKPGDEVTLTVRGAGDKTDTVKGKVVSEGPEFLTIDNGSQEEMIRSSEIMRIARPKSK
jgi:hypothetical protein